MKASSKASAACLCLLFAFLYMWQYVVDPRTRERLPASVLEHISRIIIGEHCLEGYKIDNRQEAVAYARQIWRGEEPKLTLLDDEAADDRIFKSDLFLGGGRDRELNGAGWLVRHSVSDGWHVSYSVLEPDIGAYLFAEFTD